MVEDPPDIDVTSTRSDLTWWTEGNTFYSHHLSVWEWFVPTGWFPGELTYRHQNNGTYATTNTFGTYGNTIFCSPVALTYTRHSDTFFRGWSDGSYRWRYELDWGGDCAFLLHGDYLLVTP